MAGAAMEFAEAAVELLVAVAGLGRVGEARSAAVGPGNAGVGLLARRTPERGGFAVAVGLVAGGRLAVGDTGGSWNVAVVMASGGDHREAGMRSRLGAGGGDLRSPELRGLPPWLSEGRRDNAAGRRRSSGRGRGRRHRHLGRLGATGLLRSVGRKEAEELPLS
ncbi:hypothetical protein MLD38_000264 [Melastoma candidum]|uniref:Uncharacterized protein n=1 Tax=Melastoma candidum TaxID=119954 RepID=A0ACB9SEF7_9MYRT|nr:hypothetical protein MLD38_000264 [Melastoma candidum]